MTFGPNGVDSPLGLLIRGTIDINPSGPCKQIGPTLEEISNEMADQVIIAKHNIDENPNRPVQYGVRGIPTMLLFKDGELKANKVGATTKSNIVSWIKENI